MEQATRRLLFGHVVSGVTTLVCLGAALYLRHRAFGDYKSMILPPSLLALELAAIMAMTVFGSLAQPMTGSDRRLYYLAAALALFVAIAWLIGWGVGPVSDVRSAVGKPVAVYVAAALPLLATAWALRLVDRAEWLVRFVIPPLTGFAGTLAIVPVLLTVGCALSGDCL
jgi:hypothetical protein